MRCLLGSADIYAHGVGAIGLMLLLGGGLQWPDTATVIGEIAVLRI